MMMVKNYNDDDEKIVNLMQPTRPCEVPMFAGALKIHRFADIFDADGLMDADGLFDANGPMDADSLFDYNSFLMLMVKLMLIVMPMY